MSQDGTGHKDQSVEQGCASKESVAPAPSGSDQKRRKFIKAGLIGAPILLTLKGRKAWAGSDDAGSGGSATMEGSQFPGKGKAKGRK
jgi:hypothetical protein